MTRSEYDAADDVGERDVGGGRDRPAPLNGVVGVGAEESRQTQIDRDRSQHSADGGEQGSRGLAPAQAAVPEYDGLPDFLGGNGEKEGHQHVVNQVMKRQGAMYLSVLVIVGMSDYEVIGEDELDEIVIAVGKGVGPDQCQDGARDEKHRICGDEIPDPVHQRFPPSPDAKG